MNLNSPTWAIRGDQRTLDARAALEQPAGILIGVNKPAATALAGADVVTVFDLATSTLFANAVDICLLCEHATGRFAPLGRIPRDVLRSAHDTPLGQLPLKPISIMASRASEQALTALAAALDISSIHDLAAWLPYHTSLEILACTREGRLPADGALSAAEAPPDLIPANGKFPTERVQYETLLFDGYLEPPEKGRDLATSGPLDVSALISADGGYARPALGAVITHTQSWYTEGLALGNLIHSIALGPGESTRLAMIDWSRRTRSSATEEIGESESLVSDLTRTRALTEITSAVANETQSGSSTATNFATASQQAESTGRAGIAAPFPSGPISPGVETGGTTSSRSTGFSLGTAWSTSSGHRDLSASLTQDIADRTHQASHVARSRRASIVREVSQQESESVSTRTLTNYNHMHALTIEYYEMVQLYRTVVELTQASRCLFIPMKLIDFRHPSIVDRYRAVLASAALSPAVREALDYPTGTTRARAPGILQSGLYTPPSGGTAPKSPLDILSEDRWNARDVREAQLATGGLARLLADGRLVLPSDAVLADIDFAHKDPAVKPADLLIRKTDGTSTTLTYGPTGWDMSGGRPRLDEVAALAVTASGASTSSVGFLSIIFGFKSNSFRIVIPVRLEPGGQAPALYAATVPADVISHLEDNRLYYSHAIWRSLDAAMIGAMLSDIRFPGGPHGEQVPLVQLVDPTPVTITANYLVLRMSGEDQEVLKRWLTERNIRLGTRQEDLVPVPSGGVFAEAVLGRFNSAEKLDLTRFWNWQDSPPPIAAPEIAAIQTGSRGTPDDLTPGQLGPPVLNIMNAPQLPDPQGMGAVLAAIQNGAMFRDMSGLAATIGLAQAGLAGAQQGATAAGAQAGQNAAVAAELGAKAAELAAKLVAAYFTGGASLSAGAGAEGLAGLAGGISGQGAKVNYGKDMDSRGVNTAGADDRTGASGVVEPPTGGFGSSNGTYQAATPPRGGEQTAFQTALWGGTAAGVLQQMGNLTFGGALGKNQIGLLAHQTGQSGGAEAKLLCPRSAAGPWHMRRVVASLKEIGDFVADAAREGNVVVHSLGILAHGDQAGRFIVGPDTIEVRSLPIYAGVFDRLNQLLHSNGEVIILGCISGTDAQGSALLKQISNLLPGRDVVGFNSLNHLQPVSRAGDACFDPDIMTMGYDVPDPKTGQLNHYPIQDKLTFQAFFKTFPGKSPFYEKASRDAKAAKIARNGKIIRWPQSEAAKKPGE